MQFDTIYNTVFRILELVPKKAKQTWTTLHYADATHINEQKVNFTTCNLINPAPGLTDYMTAVHQLEELIGTYNMGYVICRTAMPSHTDKFETGSHRVLLTLSDNRIQIGRSNAEDIIVEQGDWFVVDTLRPHSATVISGDPNQEFLIVENNWYSYEALPQHLTAISR